MGWFFCVKSSNDPPLTFSAYLEKFVPYHLPELFETIIMH